MFIQYIRIFIGTTATSYSVREMLGMSYSQNVKTKLTSMYLNLHAAFCTDAAISIGLHTIIAHV